MSLKSDDYARMFDWDELKVFVAVARGGSTSAAARALGVNQTTVSRRLESLERSLALKLVERSQSGAEVTEAGRALLKDCEAMQQAAERIAERARQLRRETAGAIRVTCSELAAQTALTPLLAEFRQVHPDIAVEMLITDDLLDLEAGEADVALRGSLALEDSNLVARKIHETDWAFYCSADYAARRGLPATLSDMNNHTVIAGDRDGPGFPGMQQLMAAAPNAEIGLRCNSLTSMVHAIQAGFGVGPLPCAMADLDPTLVQAIPPLPGTRATSWIVVRPDSKDTPRIRAFVDFMVPRILALGREFEARAEEIRQARRTSA